MHKQFFEMHVSWVFRNNLSQLLEIKFATYETMLHLVTPDFIKPLIGLVINASSSNLFICVFITFGGNQVNPNSANALNLRDASMKCLETDLFKKSSFRCRRENRRTRRKPESITGNKLFNLRDYVASGNTRLHQTCNWSCDKCYFQ